MTEESLFLAALDHPDPDARRRFLDDACAADRELRKRLDVLLAAFATGKDRLEPPGDDATRTAAGPALTADFQPGPGPGIVIAGRYKLLEPIGEGGMGEVWVARQTEPVQRKVALKLIKPGMDSQRVVARFEAERQALALMDHPNIAKVLDGGLTADRRPYFVMELVNGQPLTKFCDEARLTPRQRLELFVPVCQAVQHAHQKGIVHRDLKPSNILVTLYDGKPVPKVIDFGVAKATGGRLTDESVSTQFGAVVGTFEYMAPEQAGFSALDVDTRADIYSLGVILYELLTGLRPFDGPRLRKAAIDELFRILREEDPPRPSTKLSTDASLPSAAAVRGTDPKRLTALMKGELDWIVMKCLEKDRARRYETANGLARDVQRYLADEVVEARPPSAGYRVRKFVRRNRGRVVAAGLLVLTLVAGVVGTTAGMIRAGRAEGAAETARADAVAERDAAVAARKQTFLALTDLTDSAVEERLTRKADLSPDERAFLERIIARYDALAAGLPEGGEPDAMRGRCLRRVGVTYFHLGDFDRALAASRRAEELLRRVREAVPDDPDLLADHVACLNGVSACYSRMDRSAESDRWGGEALALAEHGHRVFPENATNNLTLAQILDNRVRGGGQDWAAQAADVDRAIALAEAEVRRDRASVRGTIILAYALESRAGRAAEDRDVEAARAVLARVAALADAGGPAGKSVHLDLIRARCVRLLGRALLRADQADAGLVVVRESVDRFERLRAEYPGVADIRDGLMRAFWELADGCRNAGRTAEADDALRRAAALSASTAAASESVATLGEFIDLTAALARTHFQAGRETEGKAAAAQLVEAGRKLAARFGPPGPAHDPERNRLVRQQAHRFRQIADLAGGPGGRPADGVEFGTLLLAFVRAARPAGRPDAEVFNLTEAAHWGLSVHLEGLGRPADVRAHWDDLVRMSAWDHPDSYNDAAVHHLAGKVAYLKANGQPADPAAVLAPGFADRQARLKAEPAAEATRLDLRRGYRVIGLILEVQGRHADALAAYDRALAVAPIPDASHQVRSPAERELLMVTLMGRVVCLEALGRTEEADTAWETFRKFAPADRVAEAIWRQVPRIVRTPRAARAVALAERFIAGDVAAGDLYNAACTCAVASTQPAVPADQRERFAARAIELLRRARAAGYPGNPAEVEHVRKDPDLDPVRGRADFREAFPEGVPPNKK